MKKTLIGLALLALANVAAAATQTTGEWTISNFNYHIGSADSADSGKVVFLPGTEQWSYEYSNSLFSTSNRTDGPLPLYNIAYGGIGSSSTVAMTTNGFASDDFYINAKLVAKQNGPYNFSKLASIHDGFLSLDIDEPTVVYFSFDYDFSVTKATMDSFYGYTVTIDTGVAGGKFVYDFLGYGGGLTTSGTVTTNFGLAWEPGVSNRDFSVRFDFITTAIPEPSSYALLGLGLGVIGFSAKRRLRTI